MSSILKPSESVTVGLGVAAGVFAIYSNLPSVPDIRVSEPGDTDMNRSERAAAWLSVAFVGGVAAVTKDPTVFVIGGAAMIAISWWHKHAAAFDPETGRIAGTGAQPMGLTYAQMASQAESGAEEPAGAY